MSSLPYFTTSPPVLCNFACLTRFLQVPCVFLLSSRIDRHHFSKKTLTLLSWKFNNKLGTFSLHDDVCFCSNMELFSTTTSGLVV